MSTNFLKFCMAGSADGVAFVVGVLGVDCAAGVGSMWIELGGRGNCSVLPLLPQSATGGLLPSSPIGRQQHQCMRIQNFLLSLLVAAVDTAPPPWCHSGTPPLEFLPLDEHFAGQALKLMFAGCQIYDQFHFAAHLIFDPESSPRCQFPYWPGHPLPSVPL